MAVDFDALLRQSRAREPDVATSTLMAPLCFQCGMPLNNAQDAYERVMQETGPAGLLPASVSDDPTFHQRVFAWLRKDRLCCRVNLSRSAADSRLRFSLPPCTPFAKVHRDSKEGAPPVVVLTDGTTRIHERPPPEWLSPAP